MNGKHFVRLTAPVLAALLLAGCGQASAPTETLQPPAPAETDAPILYEHRYDPDSRSLRIGPEEAADLCAQAADLRLLSSITLTEPVRDGELLAMLRGAFPEAALQYSVELLGETVPGDTAELDLSGLAPEDVDTALEALALLPELSRVTLSDEQLSLADVGRFQALPSAPTVAYPIRLYGREFSTADDFMDLNHVPVRDGGEALREALPYMTACRQLEMEYCGLSNEEMAQLRDDFPAIKVVWRVDFSMYTARTDETRILASLKGAWMTGKDCEPLKYCTEVRYLDLGHNIIDDISFVQYMPDLEVAILAINYWSDASPLAACTKLEYLEIFNTRCTDLSPLAGLTSLRHLNVAWIHELEDITPLYGLTGLERLWIGGVHQVPQEQLEEIQRRLPDTRVNVTTLTPTGEGWRVDERYDLLREQIGYDRIHAYATH